MLPKHTRIVIGKRTNLLGQESMNLQQIKAVVGTVLEHEWFEFIGDSGMTQKGCAPFERETNEDEGIRSIHSAYMHRVLCVVLGAGQAAGVKGIFLGVKQRATVASRVRMT